MCLSLPVCPSGCVRVRVRVCGGCDGRGSKSYYKAIYKSRGKSRSFTRAHRSTVRPSGHMASQWWERSRDIPCLAAVVSRWQAIKRQRPSCQARSQHSPLRRCCFHRHRRHWAKMCSRLGARMRHSEVVFQLLCAKGRPQPRPIRPIHIYHFGWQCWIECG